MNGKSSENSKKISVTKREFLDAVRELASGLAWVSETDAAIEPFVGDEAPVVTTKELCRQLGFRSDTAIVQDNAAEVLRRLSADHDWHGPAEQLRAKRFEDLRRYLDATLTDLKLFRVGNIRKDIFIVGLDSKGRLAGIRTSSVET